MGFYVEYVNVFLFWNVICEKLGVFENFLVWNWFYMEFMFFFWSYKRFSSSKVKEKEN